MKRILSIIVTISIIISAVSTALLSSVSAAKIDNGYTDGSGEYVSTPIGFEKADDKVEIGAAPLRFEYYNKNSNNYKGYADVRDGKFVLVGRRETSDTKIMTKGITGQNLTDFTMKYVYNVAADGWGYDGVFFHTATETPSAKLSVLIIGRKFRTTSPATTKPIICITKNTEIGSTAINNATYDSTTGIYTHSDGVFKQADITAKTDYNIEIAVSGNKVDVYVYKTDASKPSKPTLSYTDNTVGNTSGDIAFIGRTGGCTLSKITIKDTANNKTICNNYSPTFYNNKAYTHFASGDMSAFLTTGNIAHTDNGYRLYSKSDVDGTNRPITSSAVKPPFNGTTENYNLKFDYIHNVSGGKSSVWLNSDGTAANTKLTLDITDTTIGLLSDTTTVKSASNTLTVGKSYTVEVEKTALTVRLWIYEKGTAKPTNPIIDATLSAVAKQGAVYFYTENGDFTVNNISLYANDGYFDIRNGKFAVAGKTTANGDAIVLTKGITGKNLTDFTMEYTFRTPEVRYSRNFITIHTNVENPHPSDKYVFAIIGGIQNASDGGYSTPSIIRGATSNKGSYVTDADFHINANSDYRVKIKLTRANKKIEAWIWKLGEAQPTAPTLTYTHNDIASSSGDIAIGCRGSVQMISDLTIIDDANSEVICQNYSPIIYNDSSDATRDIASFKNSGTVMFEDGGYRISANSQFDGAIRPVGTAALPMGDIFGNFEMSLQYRTNIAGATNKVLFNNVGDDGFALTLSDTKVALFENGGLLTEKAFSVTQGKTYTVDISRFDYSVNIYVYEKGAQKPQEPTLTYTDKYPLSKGDICFYTANGDFTISAIDLEITDIPSDSNAVTSKHAVFENPEITIQKYKADGISSSSPFIQYGGGTVNMRNGRVVISAQTEAIDGINDGKSQSLWVTTKGITGKKLEDYTFKYSYIPASNSWNVDTLVLRADSSDSPNRQKGYIFGIQGKEYQKSFDKGTIIWIKKDSGGQISTDTAALDNNVAVYTDYEVTVGTEYVIEVAVTGTKIELWMYKAGESKPQEPTISYIDTANSYTSGDIAFAARDEGYSISDITLVDKTNNITIAKDYTPQIYNNKALDFTAMSGGKIKDGKVTGTTYDTGTVSLVNGVLHINSENGVEVTTYTDTTIKTNALMYKDTKYFSNFELCFVAAFSERAQNTIDVYFNSYIYGSEYKLSLDKANGTANIYKGETLVATAEYAFKTGFDYQIILSKKGSKIELYIYKAGTDKPTPWITYTDSDPLPEGTIYFGTEKGEFTLADIALMVNDADVSGNPFYKLDFENGMGDAVQTRGTSELVKDGDNTYLSVTRDNNGDGASHIVFGPQEIGDFTISMDVRITENQNSRWFYFDLRHHTNGDNLSDCYNNQIFRQGSSIAATNAALGYKVNTHKLGMSGPTPSDDVPNPQHDYNAGIHAEGEWHRVNVVSDGYLISLYIDGKLIISANDPEKLYQKGGFAIYTWGVNYDIDNIRIYSEPYYALENDLIQLGPTGLLFKKDFEGDDANKDNLKQSQGHTDKTVVMQEENGNHFLRVVGKRNNDTNDLTGTDALSRIHFGSDYIRNFDFSARVRFKSAFSANWSYITIAARADFSNYANRAYWFNIAPRGSAVVLKNNNLGFSSGSNVVATTGNVTGTAATAYIPNDSREKGMALDGRWHDIKLTARGYTFTLYIDGKEVMTYTDPDETYTRGAVYIYGYGANYDLDDILVTNYDAYTPKTEPVNTTVYTNTNEIKLKEKQVTGELLSTAGAKSSELSEFEWQFDYRAGSENWGRTSFMFRSNDSSTVLDSAENLSKNKNIFGLTITGTNISAKTGKENIANNIKNNAITVFYPNQDVEYEKMITPVTFEKEKDVANPKNIPTKDAYLLLDANKTQPAIKVNEWMTVNIKLLGNKLYVQVWQTDNKEATFRRQLFTIPYAAVNELTKGDFVISNGNNTAHIKNIVISNEELVKMKAPAQTQNIVTQSGNNTVGTSPATGDSTRTTVLKLILTLNALIVGCSALVLFTYNKTSGKHSR